MRLLSAATATGAGGSVSASTADRTFQATVSGTGAVSATVAIEASNDNTNWLTMGTITLSGATSDSDGFAASAKWDFLRANVTAISGTDAAVTVTMGA